MYRATCDNTDDGKLTQLPERQIHDNRSGWTQLYRNVSSNLFQKAFVLHDPHMTAHSGWTQEPSRGRNYVVDF